MPLTYLDCFSVLSAPRTWQVATVQMLRFILPIWSYEHPIKNNISVLHQCHKCRLWMVVLTNLKNSNFDTGRIKVMHLRFKSQTIQSDTSRNVFHDNNSKLYFWNCIFLFLKMQKTKIHIFSPAKVFWLAVLLNVTYSLNRCLSLRSCYCFGHVCVPNYHMGSQKKTWVRGCWQRSTNKAIASVDTVNMLKAASIRLKESGYVWSLCVTHSYL